MRAPYAGMKTGKTEQISSEAYAKRDYYILLDNLWNYYKVRQIKHENV